MRYAPFLPDGGTIAFAAPSFGCATEPYRSAFDHAQEKLRSLGYYPAPGPGCYAAEGIGISRSPKACAQEINDLYPSAENDVLISCGGGELMCEILDHVDFAALRAAAPKWFMGFSDNTNLAFLLPTLCDTASIYGPCAGAFGMEPWHSSVQDAFRLLTGQCLTVHNYDFWEKESNKSEDMPLAPYHVTEPVRIRSFSPSSPQENAPVQFSGRLLGGCMDCLVNLTGTIYDKVPEFIERYAGDGIIWFLESCDLNVFAIRRAIWQMRHAGWFAHVKGFLIGRPLCFGQEMMGLDQYHAVYDLLEDLQVPVLMDVDLGHLPPMMPLINGSCADVTFRPVQNRQDCAGQNVSSESALPWQLEISMRLD